MHFHPILIVKAESLAEAKTKARDFCDNECGDHSYFDYGGIVPDDESKWNKPLKEVKDNLPVDDYLEKASHFITVAHRELERNGYDTAGYNFRKAGELYSQCFTIEYPVYNIEYYDYSREYCEGWYAIEADLHF